MNIAVIPSPFSLDAIVEGPCGNFLSYLAGFDLTPSMSWRGLRSLVADENDRTDGGFVDRARKLDGTASSGERILLHAFCYAMDFGWLADQLAHGHVWRRLDCVSGHYRAAVIGCLIQDERFGR